MSLGRSCAKEWLAAPGRTVLFKPQPSCNLPVNPARKTYCTIEHKKEGRGTSPRPEYESANRQTPYCTVSVISAVVTGGFEPLVAVTVIVG